MNFRAVSFELFGVLGMYNFGQWFNPQHLQLEKVVYLDENSQTHTKIVQMAKKLERTLGHIECCSAPSLCWVPACDPCERHTFTKHKK